MNVRPVMRDFADMPRIEALAKEAFPPEEYLAPTKLIDMAESGEVDFWALYDGRTFVGFMVIARFERMAYLFFLAIEARQRSHGYGGKALALLDTLYPDSQHVVDFEMIDEAAPNNAQRKTRRAFYIRHGYRETGKFISYLGVDYEILCRDTAFDFPMFQRMMHSFRIEGFHPAYFERNRA